MPVGSLSVVRAVVPLRGRVEERGSGSAVRHGDSIAAPVASSVWLPTGTGGGLETDRTRPEPRPNAITPPALHFGLLCDGGPLPPWAVEAIEQLRQGGAVLEAAVVVPDARAAARSLPVRLYASRITERQASAAVPLSQVAPDVRRFEGRDIERARSLGLEFLLAIGVDRPGGALLELARDGVWAFDFDLDWATRIGLGEVRRVLAGEPAIEAALVRLRPEGVDVLREGAFRGDDRRPQRGLALARTESASWPAWAWASGARFGRPRNATAQPGGPPTGASPGARTLARFGGAVVRNHLRVAWARLFRHPQWNIGIVDRPIHTFLTAGEHPPVRWYPLRGRDAFLADPFGVGRADGGSILFEHFEYRKRKGTIRSIGVSDGAFEDMSEDVLGGPEHLSYPCLVEHEGRLFCVPEALETREVGLYEAESFPTRWRKVARLVDDVTAMDPTVFRHEGRWWLTYIDGRRQTDADLHVWHAPALDGPWVEHAANPVKMDVRSARPAGIPFRHDGALYRPAQDCSRRYGWRVVIHRVDRLTPDEFVEEPVAIVEPSRDSPYPAGRHTLTSFGDSTLVDGHRFVFVPVAFLHFLGIWAADVAKAVRLWGRR